MNQEANEVAVKGKREFRGFGLVEFLKQKENIQEQLNAGYPLKQIWRSLREHGEIEQGYVQFWNYTQAHIRSQNSKPNPHCEDGDISNDSQTQGEATNSGEQEADPGDENKKKKTFSYTGKTLPREELY